MLSITKEDLYKNQYSRDVLKANIYGVSLLDILKTQKLEAEFCVKYILNSDFQFLEEDQQITIETVKEFQPHILRADLLREQVEAAKKKKIKIRVDSFDFLEYCS
jgi:hypothetical protein